MSRYARLHRHLNRLERRIGPLLPAGKNPDAWFEDLSDDGFLEAIIPCCRVEATIYNPEGLIDSDYLPAYRQLARQVIAEAEAGRCREARQNFSRLEKLRRFQHRPDWRTLVPEFQPQPPESPTPSR